MEEARRRVAILLAASILVAPRLREMRDTPALRAAVAEAIRVAEYILRVIESQAGKDAGVPRPRTWT